MQALALILKLPNANVPADDTRRHTLTFPELPEPPKPINPEAKPIEHTDVITDYPRELVGGSVPEWINKKIRKMHATVTIGITEAKLDAIADPAKKKAMQDVFTVPKSFGGVDYLTDEFSTEFNATEAKNKEYSRVTDYDLGETPPDGIAADVLAQYSRVRHQGSVTVKETELSKSVRIGKAISFSNGIAEWSTMGEIVQGVDYDVTTGETTASFGPPPRLGVEDMIDRLGNHKRASFSYPNRDNDESPLLGATLGTPFVNSSRKGAGNFELKHPWKVGASGEALKLKLTGGVVNMQNQSRTVDDVLDFAVEETTGIYLVIIREDDTRLFASDPTFEAHAEPPTSDYYNQYVLLAEVELNGDNTAIDCIVQHRFEAMDIYEALVVANGQFQLGPFELSGFNAYSPPE